jgi:tRNA uridine 5-carboxymethylaminomethyl modification enzyme
MIGCVDSERYQAFFKKREQIKQLKKFFAETKLSPQTPGIERFCGQTGIRLSEPTPLAKLLRRPEVQVEHIAPFVPRDLAEILGSEDLQVAVNDLKYEGYVASQQQLAQRIERVETQRIPADFDYRHIPGLSREMVDKFTRVRPLTLGQARRIPGVTPAAVSILHIHLELQSRREKPEIRT